MGSMPTEFFSWAKELVRYSKLLCDFGFAKANGGNLSLKIAEDLIMTTPTMVSKGELNPDDMVVCTLKGDIVFGSRSPSSELHSHLAIYNTNENAKAIVHSHPPYTCSYAYTNELPTSALSAESILWLGDLCIIPFITPGSIELSKEIERKCKGRYVLILKNHGLLTWGESLQNAMWRTEEMERYCEISHIIAARGALPTKLSNKQISLLEKLKGGFIK